MADLPLRFALRYDPIFLDLGRRLRDGFLGKMQGAALSAVVGSPQAFGELCSFLLLLFGIPRDISVSADPAQKIGRVFLLYEPWACVVDAAFVPAAVPPETGVSVSGSVNGTRGFIEFRFGTERLCAFAPGEDRSVRLAVPEGDGAYYREMDLARPDGERLVPDARDAEVRALVARALGGAFSAFPGSE